MSQERLNRLGILVIKNKLLEELKYKNLISQLHIKKKIFNEIYYNIKILNKY